MMTDDQLAVAMAAQAKAERSRIEARDGRAKPAAPASPPPGRTMTPAGMEAVRLATETDMDALQIARTAGVSAHTARAAITRARYARIAAE